MAIILDAASQMPIDREEAIRALIWDTVVRVEIEHHPDPARIHAQGQISGAGRLTICSVRSNATTVTRTPRLANDPVDPYLFLGLQVSGSSIVVQDGREAVLRPGDLAVYDTRRPYTLVNDQGIHQHFFRIPIDDMSLPSRVLGAVTAVRLDGRRPLARITGSQLRTLAENVGRLGEHDAERIGEPSLALVRAMLASQIDDLPETREYLDRSLEHRILLYMTEHLRDPELSAGHVAHVHHVSVRHLYRLLGKSGVVFGDWVRRQRLEGCRRTLCEAGETRPISAIAHEWGFVDMTHFGRVFKTTYGMPPREWRTASRAARWPVDAPGSAHHAESRSR